MNPDRTFENKEGGRFILDLVLDSKVSEVDVAMNALEDWFVGHGWSKENFLDFYYSLHETIANAIVHGNLGVKEEFGEKGEVYDARRDRAQYDPENLKKKVTVHVDIGPEGATIIVHDEGEGFDLSFVPDPTDPDRLLEQGGRGLFLLYQSFDQVAFSKGEVRLFKRRPPPAVSV